MIYIVAVISVLSVLCGVSIYKARSVKGGSDFMVAGRSLSWPVLIFTLLSSWIGAGSLLGGAENAYKNGFAALWQPAGGWCGLVVVSLIASRARRFAQFTVPDILDMRFGPVVRVLATLAIVLSYTVIASYQFIGGGDILHLIFPSIDRVSGMYIVAAFVIVFTAAAGMASIAYLDLVIGSLVSVTLIIAVPILIQHSGGWNSIGAALPPSHLNVFAHYTWAQRLGLLLPTMLLLIGNQGMYQKFFSARSERDARLAVYGWIIGTLVLETLLVSVAVIASATLRTDHPREIIPLVGKQGLPPLIGAVLLGGVFAKVISTANNFLFSPATNLVHDVYERFINPDASQRRLLLVSRLTVACLGVFALLQATQFESVLKASLYAYTIYGAAITPVIMAVFFWPRATRSGAIASIITGAVVTVVWNILQGLQQIALPSWMRDLDAIYPALISSLICLIGISLLTNSGVDHRTTEPVNK